MPRFNKGATTPPSGGLSGHRMRRMARQQMNQPSIASPIEGGASGTASVGGAQAQSNYAAESGMYQAMAQQADQLHPTGK